MKSGSMEAAGISCGLLVNFSIELTYRVLPEEWYRFEPGYEPRIPMGPIVRGE